MELPSEDVPVGLVDEVADDLPGVSVYQILVLDELSFRHAGKRHECNVRLAKFATTASLTS